MIQKILAGIAALAAILLCLVAGMRDDHEVIATAAGQQATLTLPSESTAAFFVCLPEAREKELPHELLIGDELVALEAPRPFKMPAKDKHEADIAMSCGSAGFAVHAAPDGASEQTFVIPDLPDGTTIITASSKSDGWLLLILLFTQFLGTLWAAVALASKKCKRYAPPLKPYDALTACVVGMGLVLLISLPFAQKLQEPSAQILPTFLEFLPVVAVNFVALLTTFAGFILFRTKFRRGDTPAQSAQVPQETGEACDSSALAPREPDLAPPFSPLLSLGLGVGLAIIAAITLALLAPTVELTDIEMATQLVSTSYLTFIFAILAGVSEECFFRGLIQGSLEARKDSRRPLLMNAIAVAVASALFVGVHVPQSIGHLWALVPIAAVSVTSGVLKIKYQSLYPSILLHMTYNTTLLLPSILQLFLFLG